MADPRPTHLLPAIPRTQILAAQRALPGIQPLDGTDWVTVDAAYSPQMAERAQLLKTRRSDVLACLTEAHDATQELLTETLRLLRTRPDFDVTQDSVTRPDRQTVVLDRTDPLGTLGHILSEDLCILQKTGAEHILTAGLLCFPASWSLSEKLGKSLTTIHDPVPPYDDTIARRTQRLFDGVRPGQPIWRANLLQYADLALYQPRRMSDPRVPDPEHAAYYRSEKQVIWRLPKTDAVVFTIHTSVARHTG